MPRRFNGWVERRRPILGPISRRLIGPVSGPFSLLPAAQRRKALDAVLHLPDVIALSMSPPSAEVGAEDAHEADHLAGVAAEVVG